jgi:hypothetical protein
MKDFMLIFRAEAMPEIKLTSQGTLDISKEWENWMGGIAAQNKLVSVGNRLGNDGMTVKPGNIVTSGPYAEIKEFVGGYTVIRAESVQEAAEIAKTCPILAFGGNVEIRDIVPMN